MAGKNLGWTKLQIQRDKEKQRSPITSFLGAYWEQNGSCWMNHTWFDFHIFKKSQQNIHPIFIPEVYQYNIIHKRCTNYLVLNMSWQNSYLVYFVSNLHNTMRYKRIEKKNIELREVK